MMTRPHDNYTPASAPAAGRMFHNLANRVLGTFRGQPAEPDMHIFVTRDVVRMRDGSMSLAGSSAATWAAEPAPQRSARRNAMAGPLGSVWATQQDSEWEQENVGPTGVARARAQTLAKLTGQMTASTAQQPRGGRSSHPPSVPDLRTAARLGGREVDLERKPKNRRARDTMQTAYTIDSIDTSASAMWRRRQRVQSESARSAPTSLVGPWQQARPTYFGQERVPAVGPPQYIGDIDEDDDEDDDYDEIPFLPDGTPLPIRDSLPHSVASTFGSQSRPSSTSDETLTGRTERMPPPRDWRRENEVLRQAGLSGAPQLQRSASVGNGLRMGVHPSAPLAGAAVSRGLTGRRVLGVVNQNSRPQASQQGHVYGPSYPRPMNHNGQPLYEDWNDPRRRSSRPAARVSTVSSVGAVAYFPLG